MIERDPAAYEPPCRLRLLSDYVDLYAATTPDAVAVIDGDRQLTYAELAAEVERIRGILASLGITRGDRVATLATPSWSYYVTMLATIGLGAIWVGLNPRYRYDEIAFIARDCSPKAIFFLTKFEGRDYRPDFERLAREIGWAHLIALGTNGVGDIEGPAVGASTTERPAVETMDAAVVVYTSGSSGRPKGALLSHHGLIYGALAQHNRWRLPTVNQICFWPINHVGCVGDLSATTLVIGGTLTFQPRFDPKAVLDAIAGGRANVFLAVPTMLQLIMNDPAFTDESFAPIAFLVWGGAALPRPYIERLVALCPRVATIYGMTEAAANTTYSDEGADVDVLFESVGKPLPEFPTRIADGERVLGPGEPGEIQHFGDYLTLGYFNQPEATRDAFTGDGWYRTGDVGFWRRDGNIQLVGRMKEMFKSGGYNVYPREIELAIEQHPAIVMAAVVSVPDPLYQEVGVAFVVPKSDEPLTAEALRVYCRERLANYKVPKRFVIRSELPRLPIGKIDKVSLRTEAMGS